MPTNSKLNPTSLLSRATWWTSAARTFVPSTNCAGFSVWANHRFSSALLTVLMLRGPQTAGELRLNCERLHKFADISAVEAFLEELAARSDGALVIELPRLPGARENRWAHLLSGQPAIESGSGGRGAASSAQEIDELRSRVAVLESEVGALREIVDRLLG